MHYGGARSSQPAAHSDRAIRDPSRALLTGKKNNDCLESRGFIPFYKIVKKNSEEAKQQQHFTLFIKVQILYAKVIKLAPRDRKAISTERAVLWDRES